MRTCMRLETLCAAQSHDACVACMQEKVLAAATRTLVDVVRAMLGHDADSHGARTLPPLARSDLERLQARSPLLGTLR